MATLYISEFRKGSSSIGTEHVPVLPQPAITDQTVVIGAGSLQSAAFNAATRAIMISCDAVCSILIGDNPVAAATNFRLPANVPPLEFGVQPGQKIAVITNS